MSSSLSLVGGTRRRTGLGLLFLSLRLLTLRLAGLSPAVAHAGLRLLVRDPELTILLRTVAAHRIALARTSLLTRTAVHRTRLEAGAALIARHRAPLAVLDLAHALDAAHAPFGDIALDALLDAFARMLR